MSLMGVAVASGQEKTEWSGRSGESKALQKMKNSWNEAKNSLKTKDITFLKGANFVRFACKLTLISRQKEQKTLRFAKTNRKSAAQGKAAIMTNSRLDKLRVASAPTSQVVEKPSRRCLSEWL